MNDREVCWHPWPNISGGREPKEVLRARMVKVEQEVELSLEKTASSNR